MRVGSSHSLLTMVPGNEDFAPESNAPEEFVEQANTAEGVAASHASGGAYEGDQFKYLLGLSPIARQIYGYCSNRDLASLRKTTRIAAYSEEMALAMARRKAIKANDKARAMYKNFYGRDLDVREAVKIIAPITGDASAELLKDKRLVHLKLAGAFEILADRIRQAGEPTEANGRVLQETIRGIPGGHRITALLTNVEENYRLCVTEDLDNIYLYELKKDINQSGVFEAFPSLRYGQNAAHMHRGKCLAVSQDNIVMQYSLNFPGYCTTRILATTGDEKPIGPQDEENDNLNLESPMWFFARCANMSTDGRSLLFSEGSHDNCRFPIHHISSSTPEKVSSFVLDSIDLESDRSYFGNWLASGPRSGLIKLGSGRSYLGKDGDIREITQAADHTWALMSFESRRVGRIYKSGIIFSPLPLDSERIKIVHLSKYKSMAMAMMPDNNIAVATDEGIKIFGNNGEVQETFTNIQPKYVYKMKVSPDGKSVACIESIYNFIDCRGAVNFSLYQLRSAPSARAENELTLLWRKTLHDNQFVEMGYDYFVPTYDFQFINHGQDLEIWNKKNPGQKTVFNLTDSVAMS